MDIFVGDRGGSYIILATTAVYNSLGTLEFKGNFFPPLIPLYSSQKYLTTYSKYQMSNGIENSDILRIRNLSNLSQMTQNFSGVVLT